MMKSKKIRAAVVGCGRVSRTAHYDNLRENEDFDFVAVCDIDKERADHWAAHNNVQAYYSFEEMLKNENLDIVSINVPNALHPQLATIAANHGVNVIAEKPLGLDPQECRDLIALCDAKNVRLFSVMQNRFNDTNLLLKDALEKGRFGQLLSAHVTVRWNRSQAYYDEDNGWRGTKTLARGVFTNQCIHYVDTMQWLIDSAPVSAYAKMSTALRQTDVETHGSGIVSFQNGVIGGFDLTILNYPEDREGSITVLGEKGSVKIGGKSMNKVLEWTFADKDPDVDDKIFDVDYEPPTVYGFGHTELYRRIGRILAHGDESNGVPDGAEGLKSVVILDALYRSAETGLAVEIND